MPKIVAVILCGGTGTRLWPLSRECAPKQFIDTGRGSTLFGQTCERAAYLHEVHELLVVCNEEHRFLVKALLEHLDLPFRIILEPVPRNTAPAVALAANSLKERAGELMLILPSDQYLGDLEEFGRGVLRGAELAETGRIVTFGIKPSKPETGYGYIEHGTDHSIRRFVEKPSASEAQALLRKGGVSWNSGIFLCDPKVYLSELQKFAPEISLSMQKSWDLRTVDTCFIRPEKVSFSSSPANSIDYAMMEQTQLGSVILLNTDWSDLGSWEALYQTGEQDAAGNVERGDVILDDCTGCYLHSEGRLLAALGLKNMVVVETKDAVLVAPRSQSHGVKEIVARLKKEKRPECQVHPLVHRPWGCYETLAREKHFQVKRIVVKPGASLSLQMHYHRAEHWVIVSGTAEVTSDGETRLYTENQSTYIPIGVRHRLRNPGLIDLVLIEIQSGSYLGEDDIVRFEDVYGR